MEQSDKLNRFLTGLADKIITASSWDKYGPQEKTQTQTEFNWAYHQAVKDGTVDPAKMKQEDFRITVNYLINARMKNDKKDVDTYNKKLMDLTVNSLKTGSWLGSKLNELERSYTVMTLLKDLSGGMGMTMGGLGSLESDKGVVYEMDEKEKKKREKQARFP